MYRPAEPGGNGRTGEEEADRQDTKLTEPTSIAARAAGSGANCTGAKSSGASNHPSMLPLRVLLEDPAVSKVAHDAKRDVLILRREGIALAALCLTQCWPAMCSIPGAVRTVASTCCRWSF